MSETALLDAITSLDLSDFTSGEPERKAKFVQDLGTAFNNIGFVSIRNHGLTEDLRTKLYESVQDFFKQCRSNG